MESPSRGVVGGAAPAVGRWHHHRTQEHRSWQKEGALRRTWWGGRRGEPRGGLATTAFGDAGKQGLEARRPSCRGLDRRDFDRLGNLEGAQLPNRGAGGSWWRTPAAKGTGETRACSRRGRNSTSKDPPRGVPSQPQPRTRRRLRTRAITVAWGGGGPPETRGLPAREGRPRTPRNRPSP